MAKIVSITQEALHAIAQSPRLNTIRGLLAQNDLDSAALITHRWVDRETAFRNGEIAYTQKGETTPTRRTPKIS